jgi:FKBP-type peptidyl-prolyl cis-trans isomerase
VAQTTKSIKMKYILLAIVLAFVVSSCSSDDIKDFREENEAEIAAYVAENNLSAKRSVSGLYYVVEEKGTGKAITGASDVTVNYKGYYTNGSVFEKVNENWISFSLQNAIRGFAEGLSYFNEGGKGILLIPSHLGYGSKDYNGVPAGSVLIFEITIYTPEMISEQNDKDIQAYIEKEELETIKTESGLHYIIDEQGTGAQPTAKSDVTVAYTGYFLNGKKFSESRASGESFNLDNVIKGWKEGIPYFKEGGKGKLIIPAHLGYGSYNFRSIPGGSVLVFDIELKSVKE